MSERVSCTNCWGACCQNVEIFLNPDEAKFLEDAGTCLEDVTTPNQLLLIKISNMRGISGVVFKVDEGEVINTPDPKRGELVYLMHGECGYLQPEQDGWRKCGAFGDPRRPKRCGMFKEGSNRCLQMRAR